MAVASTSSLALSPSYRPNSIDFHFHFHGSNPTTLILSPVSRKKNLRVFASVLVPSLDRQTGTDRVVLLKKEEHQKVTEVAQELQKFCVSEPVKCSLIFCGKLKGLDDKWVQVIFEPQELKVGPFEFRCGGESEVKLQITYIDDKVRVGKGSRGSLFVFQRRKLIYIHEQPIYMVFGSVVKITLLYHVRVLHCNELL